MTPTEVAQLIRIVRVCFPSWRDTTDAEDRMVTWSHMLADVELEHAVAAVRQIAVESKFVPGPGEVYRVAMDIQASGDGSVELDADEAFVAMLDAVRRFGWPNEAAAMDSLPAPVQSTVRALGGWSEVCKSENPEALRAHFRQAYSTAAERSRRSRYLGDVPAGQQLGPGDGPRRAFELVHGGLQPDS